MKTNGKIAAHIPLEGACNARHLGGYPTPDGTTRNFALIRSEAPTGMTDRDIATLLKLGVRTVIDLRNRSEIQHSPNPFAAVPTVTLHHNPIFPDDPAIHAFDWMPRGQAYCWMLDACQAALLEAVRLVARSPDGVLFHCAAGKDRTGILAALLLLLAGVDRETVAREYAYTQTLLAPWVEREAAKEPGLTEELRMRLYGAYPDYMREAVRHLENAYGGIRGYLRAIGMLESEMEPLRRRIVATQSVRVLSA